MPQGIENHNQTPPAELLKLTVIADMMGDLKALQISSELIKAEPFTKDDKITLTSYSKVPGTQQFEKIDYISNPVDNTIKTHRDEKLYSEKEVLDVLEKSLVKENLNFLTVINKQTGLQEQYFGDKDSDRVGKTIDDGIKEIKKIVESSKEIMKIREEVEEQLKGSGQKEIEGVIGHLQSQSLPEGKKPSKLEIV